MSPGSLLNALDRIPSATRVVIAGLVHRGELATVETREALNHFIVSILIGTGILAFALLTGFAVTFAIAAAVWHRDDRGLILGLVTVAYLVSACGLGWGLSRRLRAWHPLRETRRQLCEDSECIDELLSGEDSAN